MVEKLLKSQTDSTFIQLVRYTFVGAAAFAVDFSSLFVLTDLFNIYYLTSAAIAFLLGLTTNYSLSIIWVFNKRKFSKKWVEVGIFSLIGVVGLGLNGLLIWSFTEFAHFHYLFSKIISTVFIYLWNFSVRKILLFS